MSREVGRSTVTVAVIIVAVLVVLWLLRFVIGLFVGLAQIALGFVVLVGLGYAGYRLWHGWSAAGEELDAGGRRR